MKNSSIFFLNLIASLMGKRGIDLGALSVGLCLQLPANSGKGLVGSGQVSGQDMSVFGAEHTNAHLGPCRCTY